MIEIIELIDILLSAVQDVPVPVSPPDAIAAVPAAIAPDVVAPIIPPATPVSESDPPSAWLTWANHNCLNDRWTCLRWHSAI